VAARTRTKGWLCQLFRGKNFFRLFLAFVSPTGTVRTRHNQSFGWCATKLMCGIEDHSLFRSANNKDNNKDNRTDSQNFSLSSSKDNFFPFCQQLSCQYIRSKNFFLVCLANFFRFVSNFRVNTFAAKTFFWFVSPTWSSEKKCAANKFTARTFFWFVSPVWPSEKKVCRQQIRGKNFFLVCPTHLAIRKNLQLRCQPIRRKTFFFWFCQLGHRKETTSWLRTNSQQKLSLVCLANLAIRTGQNK